jgi:D-alanyl-lipoteichoic acid acyltransferase DltB (MBOAT superfamily)
MAYIPKYILILFALITLDFFLAQWLERHEGRRRLVFLWMSIVANLGILFLFKYFNFFNMNVAALAALLHWHYSFALLSFALPLGLSFHVFQSLSYVIEVYRRQYKPERNYFIYALYVMFFPQLVAGPIERPAHLLPQFRKAHPFKESQVVQGLERMLWGFFKKLVIADNLALIVGHIYGSGTTDGPVLILSVILFAYQVYCDFSGYSDIAVGTALVLGYEITENFNRPYAARSVQEFWQRWHMSLSNWLRDYLYYPLALSGKRHSPARLYISLFITFVMVGLWHGAAWTYVAMGALFGVYLIFGSLTLSARKRIKDVTGLSRLPRVQQFLQTVVTFTLVSVAFVLFRAPKISEAWRIISHLGNGIGELLDFHYLRYQLFSSVSLGPITKPAFGAIVLAILLMEIVQYRQEKTKSPSVWARWPTRGRIVWAYGLISLILWFGYLGAQPFIYFQF